MTDLVEALERGEKWLSRYRGQAARIGEQNTKAALVEPVIEGLGWDTRDPDEVHREYRRVGTDNPVDYALLLLRTPRIFVEAKGVGERLDDPRWANQTIAYATAAGVEWVVLTNGAEWRIYNAHAPVPIEQKLFRTVRLDDDLDETARILGLLGKELTGQNRIEELWKIHFVDRQVRQVLVDMFSGGEPAKELVAAVRHRVSGLSLREVRESLTRARASFEFPVAHDLPATASGRRPRVLTSSDGAGANASEQASQTLVVEPGTPTRKVRPTRRASQRNTESTPQRRSTIAGLMAAGRLRARSRLTTTYIGRTFEAELLTDGRIMLDGETYSSPSGAGIAVKVAVGGPDQPRSVLSTDGWSFWRALDEVVGDLVPLKEIRGRADTEGS